jgi:plasmid stabilization system protein ParE
MRVELLPKAVRDLEAIIDYIAADSPRGAKKVSASLADALQLIGEHPEIGRPVSGRNLRLFVVPGLPYVMPYRFRRNTVEILRVFHTSRQRPKSWS